jgi:hypothetical protein
VATRRPRRSSGARTCNHAPAGPRSRARGTHRINRPAWHAQTTYPTTPSTPRVSARITPLPETSRPSGVGEPRQAHGRRHRATASSGVRSSARPPFKPRSRPSPTLSKLCGRRRHNCATADRRPGHRRRGDRRSLRGVVRWRRDSASPPARLRPLPCGRGPNGLAAGLSAG